MGEGRRRPHPNITEERVAREGKAIAAVRGGMSQTRAAKEYGIPQSTLSKRLAWFEDIASREKRVQEAEEQILSHTLIAAEGAQREIARRVVEDPGALTVRELVPIAGNAQDKLALRLGWGGSSKADSASVNLIADAIAKIVSGAKGSVIEAKVIEDEDEGGGEG